MISVMFRSSQSLSHAPVPRLHWSQALLACLALMCGWSGCSVETRKARHLERAQNYFRDGRYDFAEIEYLNTLKLDPVSAPAIGGLGAIFQNQGRLGRALPYLKRTRELAPNDIDNRTRLATLYLAVGLRTEAIEEAIELLRLQPASADGTVILAQASSSPEERARAQTALAAAAQAGGNPQALAVAKAIFLVREGKIDLAVDLLVQAGEQKDPLAAGFSVLGSLYLAKRQIDAADAAYAKAAALAEPRSPLRVQYATFKLNHGDLPGARKILEGIVAQAPDFLPAVMRLIDLTASEGRVAEADKMLEPILLRDGSNPEALRMAIRIAVAKGDRASALAQAETLTRMYPQSVEAHLEAARLYLAQNDLSKAQASLEKALLADADSSDAAILLGAVQLAGGDIPRAIQGLTAVIKKNSGLLEARLLLAEAYKSQGDLDAAMATYEALEKDFPGREAVTFPRAQLLIKLNRFDDARLAFEQLQARNPTSNRILDQLVDLDLQQRRFGSAQQRIDAALAVRPQDAALLTSSGRLKLIRGETKAAEADLVKATTVDPRQTVAFMLLAKISQDRGDLATALKHFQTVIDHNPTDTGALYAKAMLLEKQKQVAQAKAVYERILEVDPQHARALNNLANLYLAPPISLERAYEFARRAREAAPGEAAISDTLGWVFHRRKDDLSALAPLQEAAAKLPDNAEVQAHLAIVHYTLGNATEARAAFNSLKDRTDAPTFAKDAARYLRILDLSALPSSEGDEAELRQHLADYPEDVFALGVLADRQARRGKPAEAVATLEKATSLNGQNRRNLLSLAHLRATAGNIPGAMEAARQARKFAPDDVDVIATLGVLNLRARDYAQAHALLTAASRLAADRATIWFNLGQAAYALGRVGEAKRSLEQGLQLASNDEAREQLTLIKAAETPLSSEASLALAQSRLNKAPGDLFAGYFVAVSQTSPKERISKLEAVLREYPTFAPAQRDLAMLLADQGGQDSKANELGTRARESYPNDAELGRALGILAFRLGDYRRAQDLLESGRTTFQQDSSWWYHLGLAQQKLNDPISAKRSLDQALALNPPKAMAEAIRAALANLPQ